MSKLEDKDLFSEYGYMDISEVIEDFATNCIMVGIVPKEIVFNEGALDRIRLGLKQKTRETAILTENVANESFSCGEILLTEQTKGDDNV